MRPFLGAARCCVKENVSTMPRKRGNGDGTIYKVESKGLWAAQLTIGVDANGRPKRKTVYGKRQANVRAKLDALKNELSTGSVIEPDKITVAQYILSLVETDRALNQIGDNTYLRKLASCKRIAASSIGDCPLQSVRPPQVTQYLIEITSCSNSVIAKDYALLARCFRTALDNDLIRKDPMRGMKKPKSNKATRKVRALTVEEQTRFVQVMNDQERGCRYWEQMMLMLSTGMRMGEINALDDIPHRECATHGDQGSDGPRCYRHKNQDLCRAAAFEPDRRPIPHFIRIYGTVAAQPLGSAVLRLQGSQGTDHQPSEFAISAYLKKIQCAGSVHTRRCILAQPAAYIRHPLH